MGPVLRGAVVRHGGRRKRAAATAHADPGLGRRSPGSLGCRKHLGGGLLGEPEMACVDFESYVDPACRAAEQFVNVYCTTVDKRRRLPPRLYLGSAILVRNGNALSGLESWSAVFEMLPSSEFQISVVDCQPVRREATPSQTTVLVVIWRMVKSEGNKQRDFNQNFILTAQASPSNTGWAIASDCFRFQDPAC
ncbi:unnamed protein product [Pipistrellus nathusii]|uniref:NTF2 domain-containing protein n=1 Tax=Pipistrellus nathusii TaxID=59473 RepID=A0ABP0A7A2_PIPNA